MVGPGKELALEKAFQAFSQHGDDDDDGDLVNNWLETFTSLQYDVLVQGCFSWCFPLECAEWYKS